MNRLAPTLLGVICGVSAAIAPPAHLAAGEPTRQAPADDTVLVPLTPLLPGEGARAIAAEGSVLTVNLPLLRRITVDSDDLLGLDLDLELRRAESRLEALAQGRSTAASVDLAAEPGLRRIALRAGDELAICAWKADWHFHGDATVSGLRIVRSDGVATALPASLGADAAGDGAIGRIQLIGLSARDRLPVVRGRVGMQAGTVARRFTVPGSSGSDAVLGDGRLQLHSNGRAKQGEAYDWAPALLFTAAQDGIYAIEGRLDIASGKSGQQVAWSIGRLLPPGPALTGASLEIGTPAGSLRLPLTTSPNGETAKARIDLSIAGRAWLDRPAAMATLAVQVVGGDGTPQRAQLGDTPKATATLRKRAKTTLFEHAITPRDGVFARMRDGRLYYGDDRLRLWGMVKDGSGERVRRLGFNCVRMWFQSAFYTRDSAKRGRAMEYTPGDGSSLDVYDRMMADYRANGIFVMLATTVGSGTGQIPIDLMLADDSWIAGGDDWEAWKAAVKQVKNLDGFGYVDERLWRIRMRHAENVFTHRNPYTGKRYAEDEIIALVEVNNEAGLAKRWLEGGFEKWPAYFRDQLQAQWNAWLGQRYPDRDALLRSWGVLDTDEEAGRAKLEPVLANRHRYPRARQQDLIRFVCERIDARNQEYRAFCRTLAPAGIGVNVVPFSFDSQYQPNTAWTYGNALGDTSTVSMYFWRHDSMLTAPPGLYVLDSTRTADRLSVIYETQRARPSPCRAEYPFILATMADWQDFDVVVWHGSWIGTRSDEELLAGTALPPTPDHFWNGVHLEHDPPMSAAVALAGRLFLAGTIGIADKPVRYEMGADAIFSYDVWNGIGGRDMSLDTFTRGSRIAFVPASPGGASVDGMPLAQRVKQPSPAGPVTTGPFATWDWQQGRLIIDAPTAKILVGRTPASHAFSDGITLSGLEGPFTTFALISADGRPLTGPDASRSMLVCSAGDARNTGFDFDFTVPGGPIEQAKAIRSYGHAPVVVDPAGYTLAFPSAIEGRFTAYDFALREAGSQALSGTGPLRQPGQTWWMGRIQIASRGAACTPAIDPSPGAVRAIATADMAVESTDPALAGVPHPVPGLSWGDNYQRAHRALRDSPLTKTAVSPAGQGDGIDCSITVSELDGVWGQPADLDIAFTAGRMHRIAVTFRQAPAFADLLARLRSAHGAAQSERLVAVASEQSEVRWRLPGGVTLLATEVQGVVRLVYELAASP